MSFTFIDLFAGIGGFHIALKKSGGHCVSACEIDKNARITYEYNFNNQEEGNLFHKGLFFEDITKLSGKEIPNHDILCGGFPCQAFSVAGYRKGFEDERGNLFFDVARIIKEKKPKVVFLENVKNLKNHDKGRTLATILDTLEQLGYFAKYEILNTSEYGNLPQNRERIYIVAFRDKAHYEKFRFPEKTPLTTQIQDMLEEDIDQSFFYKGKPLYERIKDDIIKENTAYQWRRQYVRENKKGVFPTLTANMGTGGHNVPIVLTKYGIRKITPRECLNIQGFPQSYKLPSISNGQLYKQVGNSVSIPVVEKIGVNIISAIN